jgi:hypothetical protein
MTEIFITNIQTNIQGKDVLNFLKAAYPAIKINYDLNGTEKAYPCGHTILKVEGDKINSENILTTVRGLGYNCEILEDKICI